jgi:hypothetical protein
MTYSFDERLMFSKGARQGSDLETIAAILDGCVSVSVASVEMDKLGVDYIATLRKGAQVLIDAKTREKGCSRYWRGQPELAIEIWSVMPGGKYGLTCGKTGWTLDEAKITDAILYTFDPSDSETVFLLPFQHLRLAARRNVNRWASRYKVDIQDNRSWESQAVFVPASEVVECIRATFERRIPANPELF